MWLLSKITNALILVIGVIGIAASALYLGAKLLWKGINNG